MSAAARYDARLPDLQEIVRSLDQPAYRAQQVFEGLYEQRRPLADLTNIPKTMRARLDELLPLAFTADALQGCPSAFRCRSAGLPASARSR